MIITFAVRGKQRSVNYYLNRWKTRVQKDFNKIKEYLLEHKKIYLLSIFE